MPVCFSPLPSFPRWDVPCPGWTRAALLVLLGEGQRPKNLLRGTGQHLKPRDFHGTAPGGAAEHHGDIRNEVGSSAPPAPIPGAAASIQSPAGFFSPRRGNAIPLPGPSPEEMDVGLECDPAGRGKPQTELAKAGAL